MEFRDRSCCRGARVSCADDGAMEIVSEAGWNDDASCCGVENLLERPALSKREIGGAGLVEGSHTADFGVPVAFEGEFEKGSKVLYGHL